MKFLKKTVYLYYLKIVVIDAGHFAASTEMGDVSNLIPAIHPFIGGVSGALHTKDFKVEDFIPLVYCLGK